MRIQSISDIITNSSSEVFVIANEYSLNVIKAIVNNLLQIGNSALTCDDLFDIKLKADGYQEYLEDMKGSLEEEDGELLSEKEYIDNREYCGEAFDNMENISIEIIPKSDEFKECAGLLNELNSLFNLVASFDS